MRTAVEAGKIEVIHRYDGLMVDTRVAIGRAARYGYRKLDGLPPTDGLTRFEGEERNDKRFFRSRIKIRGVHPSVGEIDKILTFPDRKGVTLVGTGAVVFQRFHEFPIGSEGLTVAFRRGLRTGRGAEVRYDHDREEDTSVIITDQGQAQVNRLRSFGKPLTYLYPKKITQEDLRRYHTPEDVEIGLAVRQVAALTAAEFVTDGINWAHGTKLSTLELAQLRNRWSEMIPEGKALPPSIVDLVKKPTRT